MPWCRFDVIMTLSLRQVSTGMHVSTCYCPVDFTVHPIKHESVYFYVYRGYIIGPYNCARFASKCVTSLLLVQVFGISQNLSDFIISIKCGNIYRHTSQPNDNIKLSTSSLHWVSALRYVQYVYRSVSGCGGVCYQYHFRPQSRERFTYCCRNWHQYHSTPLLSSLALSHCDLMSPI